MSQEVFVALDLSEGQRVKLTRIAKGLRQVDLACLAKCNVADVARIEKDRYLPQTRKDKILKVLGLDDGDEQSAG